MAERSGAYIEGMIEEDKRLASAGKYLVWEDITMVAAQNLRNGATSRKQLLNGISGYAEPHRIMALIGPCGSGKSTGSISLKKVYKILHISQHSQYSHTTCELRPTIQQNVDHYNLSKG